MAKAENIFKVKTDEMFTIELPGSLTSGYKWTADYDKTFLQQIGTKSVPFGESLGGGGKEIVSFKALKSGITEIKLSHKRPWEDTGMEEIIYSVKISKSNYNTSKIRKLKMAYYYVNNDPQPTGEHEVHKQGCSFMPSDKKYLGYHTDCNDAVKEAKKTYKKVDGCYFCCRACHTR
jgi:predicted secreted protein